MEDQPEWFYSYTIRSIMLDFSFVNTLNSLIKCVGNPFPFKIP